VATIKNPYLRATNEYFHDIAAGTFPGAVIGAWLIRQGFAGASAETATMLQKASVRLWWVLLVSLAVIVITGFVRLGYWHLNLSESVVSVKRRMIIIKHAAFVLTLVACLVWLFTLLPS
jgi:Ca2+/Na+ antiporter